MTRKLIAITLISTYASFYSQVGINTASPDPSSILDVHSDTKGMLLPRLTTAAVNSLSMSASEGLIVFDKDQKAFVGWDGTKWINLGYEEINTVPTATNLNITGNYNTGAALTANYMFSDAQSNPDDASAFIWKRADDATGANTAIISSATAQNYTLALADQTKFIQFCVTPGSTVGASPGAQKCSAWGGPVNANQAPTATGVNITGTTNQGLTLTGNYTYIDVEGNPQGTSVFRWTHADDTSGLNETPISGANATTYTLTPTDVNKYIKFYVTPIASSGTTTGTEIGSAFVGPINTVPLALGTWDTSTISSGGNGNFGPSPWSGTAGAGMNAVRITRDAGASQSGAGSSNAWGSDGLNSPSQAAAETANDSWSFEFVPSAGKSLSLTSIESFDFRKSAAGPKNGQYQYKIGTTGTWTNISGATISGISGGSATTVTQAPIDLSGVTALQNVTAGTTVYLRIVLWNGTASTGTANMGYQNQQIIIKGFSQ